jgi:hypothetical protein
MAKKARGDSKLDTLPPDKKAELIDGLVCGWTYRQAAEWLLEECSVRVSGSAWTPFFERNVEPILKDIRNFAKMSALSLAKRMEEEDLFERATILEFQENAYQLMRTPGADPEEKRKWMETLLKKMAGQREGRKLKLLEENAAAAKAKLHALTTAAKSNGGLTPETLAQIEEAAGLL